MPILDLATLNQTKLDALANKFTDEFATTENLRRQARETEWLQSLRQSKGLHDPEVKERFTETDSQIYSQYTRSKERPLKAKLNQHLLPEKEKNWEITPTPKPQVADSELQGIIQPLIKQDPTTGQYVFPTDDEINAAIRDFTAKRAENMSRTIDDQLTEGRYRAEQKKQIESGIRYGTGLIKGPLTDSYDEVETVFQQASGALTRVKEFIKSAFAGSQMPAGQWIQKKVKKYRPIPQFVSLWCWFPDMSTADPEKLSFAYELHSMPKHEMRDLAAREDFFGDVILDILTKVPKGNYKLRNWETELQAMKEGEQRVVDTNNYEVLERNGFVDGTDLVEAGIVTEDDPSEEYFCSIWICNRQCIKISVWPKNVIASIVELYHIFYYEKDETSIFGTGLPRIIRDRQLAINAGERHLLNHGAWLEGPCGEINLSLLHPDSIEAARKFGPLTFLASIAQGALANQKILNMYDIEDRTTSYISMLGYQKNAGDSEASLPSSLFTMPTPGGGDETSKGTTVRWENLLDFIKDIAKNFDDANTSFIRGVFRWNMAFNPDPTIKGDLQTNPKGTAQALIRDAIRQEISYFLQSLPEQAYPYFKWHEISKELLKTMFDDTEKLLYTEEEVSAMQDPLRQKQQELDALQMELAKIKGEKDAAMAEVQKAKADKLRTEIPHDAASKEINNEEAKTRIISGNLDNLHKEVDLALKVAGGNGGEQGTSAQGA